MFSSRRISSVAVAMALMGGMGAVPALGSQQKVAQWSAKASTLGNRGLFNDLPMMRAPSRYGSKGAGISMAQQQRASKKRRNIVRNRKHHR